MRFTYEIFCILELITSFWENYWNITAVAYERPERKGLLSSHIKLFEQDRPPRHYFFWNWQCNHGSIQKKWTYNRDFGLSSTRKNSRIIERLFSIIMRINFVTLEILLCCRNISIVIDLSCHHISSWLILHAIFIIVFIRFQKIK